MRKPRLENYPRNGAWRATMGKLLEKAMQEFLGEAPNGKWFSSKYNQARKQDADKLVGFEWWKSLIRPPLLCTQRNSPPALVPNVELVFRTWKSLRSKRTLLHVRRLRKKD